METWLSGLKQQVANLSSGVILTVGSNPTVSARLNRYMQTILLIGDSWGVPNYYGSPGVEPIYHTEFLLKDYGYTVYNCSLNGSSNLNTIQRAIDFLAGHSIMHPSGNYNNNFADITLQDKIKIDWVVWFHTELFRDLQILGNDYAIEQSTRLLAHKTYQTFFKFSKSLDAKTAIVGGQSPIEPEIYVYGHPNFIISDWKSEILQKKLPKLQTLSNVSWVENSKDGIDYKMQLLKLHEQHLNELRDSEHFPDNAHPGIQPHKLLVQTLDKVFKGEVAQTVRAMDS